MTAITFLAILIPILTISYLLFDLIPERCRVCGKVVWWKDRDISLKGGAKVNLQLDLHVHCSNAEGVSSGAWRRR